MATFFNNMKAGWKYSFSLFRWSEFKQIFGASALTARRALGLMMPYGLGFNVAITASAMILNACWYVPVPTSPLMNLQLVEYLTKNTIGLLLPTVFFVLFGTLIFTFALLSVRTSNERKDWCYFLSNNLLYMPLAIAITAVVKVAFWAAILASTVTLSSIPFVGGIFSTIVYITLTTLDRLVGSLGSFLPFLFFDYKTELYTIDSFKKSIPRSILAMFYFTPALLIAGIVGLSLMLLSLIFCGLLALPITWAMATMLFPLAPPIIFMGLTLLLAGTLFTIMSIVAFSSSAAIYLKLKHEQRDLFLGK